MKESQWVHGDFFFVKKFFTLKLLDRSEFIGKTATNL